jgi:hypothetical protein
MIFYNLALYIILFILDKGSERLEEFNISEGFAHYGWCTVLVVCHLKIVLISYSLLHPTCLVLAERC